MAEFDVEWIVGANLGERHLVSREMHDLARNGGPTLQADRRQVLGQELSAARYMDPGQLRSMAVGAVVRAAQVAHVVEETYDEPDGRALNAEPGIRLMLPLVAHDEASREPE